MINSKLKKLFEFQFLIIDMQKLLIEARSKNPAKDFSETEKRIDALIEIYKEYDRFYFAAFESEQKILSLEAEVLLLSGQIESLKSENEKLLKSLEWK